MQTQDRPSFDDLKKHLVIKAGLESVYLAPKSENGDGAYTEPSNRASVYEYDGSDGSDLTGYKEPSDSVGIGNPGYGAALANKGGRPPSGVGNPGYGAAGGAGASGGSAGGAAAKSGGKGLSFVGNPGYAVHASPGGTVPIAPPRTNSVGGGNGGGGGGGGGRVESVYLEPRTREMVGDDYADGGHQYEAPGPGGDTGVDYAMATADGGEWEWEWECVVCVCVCCVCVCVCCARVCECVCVYRLETLVVFVC